MHRLIPSALCIAACLSAPAVAGADWPTLNIEEVYSGLTQPLFLTHAGDGSRRTFVVEKGGRVLVYGPGESTGEVFLDVEDRVRSSGSEQGLLGLAFAPDFATSGRFYIQYTDSDGGSRISRFSIGANGRGDPTSERPVLSFEQPAANHNGGMLAFGPDGMLWIGTGDGGRANDAFGNGQDPGTLLGAMLRIDVIAADRDGYRIPPDNPWVDARVDGERARPEVWAIGLRNPWRYSFDRGTGDLWIADVGQNKWEEIDHILVTRVAKGGLNLGWPIREASHCFRPPDGCRREGLEMPVAEYGHTQGCAVTGGYVYRGTASPVLNGLYFFGDFCSGRIWAIRPDAGGFATQELADTGIAISSFGEDEGGELYVVGFRQGKVWQISGR